MDVFLIFNLIIGVAVGLLSSFIGSFAVLKRMSLVGDALSHVALPGLALAIFWNINPFWGAFLFLTAATFLIWFLETKSKLPTDAVVGILFTASLAIGILTIPDQEILESLFGDFVPSSLSETAYIAVSALALAAVALFFTKRFLFRVISKDLSDAYQKTSHRDDLLFLVLFAASLALGIKLVGTLLMGALTIIPAAVAKNISGTMARYMASSVATGVIMSAVGILAAFALGIPPGPVIILFGVFLFAVSLFFRKNE